MCDTFEPTMPTACENDDIREQVDNDGPAGAEPIETPAEPEPSEDSAPADGPTSEGAEPADPDPDPDPDEVTLDDVEVPATIPLTDAEALAYKLLKRASQLKGATIDRAAFLRGALSGRCEEEAIETAVAQFPNAADLSPETIDELAEATIAAEVGKVAGLSAIAGVPGGLLSLGAIPADIAQYVVHALRVAQELAYLYGWPSFAGVAGDLDDDALYGLVLMLGTMLQVDGTALTLSQIVDDVSEAGVEESLRQRLGEDGWHQPVRRVLAAMGDAALKGTLAEAVVRGVPVLSALVCGALSYASFRAGSKALARFLRVLPQATGEMLPEDEMAALIAQIEEDARMDVAAAVRDAMESAGERIGTIAGQAGEATSAFAEQASEAAVSFAEQAGAAANVVVDKAAEYAVAARDKAVEAAKAAAIGFIRGLGTSRRERRGDRDRREAATETPAPAEPTPAAAHPATPSAAYVEELRQLKLLLDDGIITPEEFDAKKRQLLGL